MSVHVVKGDDPILRGTEVARLVDELVGADERSLALEEHTVPGSGRGEGSGEGSGEDAADRDAGESRDAVLAAVLQAVQSPPFMTARRVVVVRDVGNLTAAAAAPLVAYLESPLESTALVLVEGGGRTPDALAKRAAAIGVVVGPSSERTADVLEREARAAGLVLRPDARDALTARLAGDAGRVPALIETLLGAFGSGATLGADDVAPYLGEAGAVPAYELTNAIDRGDVAGALATLVRLLTATGPRQPKPFHPLQVLGVLHHHYRRLLRLDAPSIRRPADAVAALGGKVKEYPARKALEQARALGHDGLRRAFDELARADLALKGASGMPGDAVLEVLVVRLAGLAAGAAAPLRRRSSSSRPGA